MSAKIIPIRPIHKTKSPASSPPARRRGSHANARATTAPIAFQRAELGQILNVYGQMVSNGLWKDYAIDMLKTEAVFSIYRRASEVPIYQIVKRPALRDRQGQYAVIAQSGQILKRGHELKSVLRVFDKQRFKTY